MDEKLPLVNVQWLSENKDDPKLILLDVSLENYSAAEIKVIPGSLKFDWVQFSEQTTELPHMMPSEQCFTSAAQRLGINNDTKLVVYDNVGIYSSPRVWWMFKAMGFDNCFILNGGLPAWLKSDNQTNDHYDSCLGNGNFIATYRQGSFYNFKDVLNAVNDKNHCIIDARSAARFHGRVDEPRAGLRRGHIPNSINIPFTELLSQNEMQHSDHLEKVFENVANKDLRLVFSCGSGVTACIDALAATIIGYKNISVYDGSWSEWGREIKNPA